MEDISPKIKLVITEDGLESVTIHGGDIAKRSKAVDLYKLLQQEVKQFQRVIKRKLKRNTVGRR